jgi:hypothetical protein
MAAMRAGLRIGIAPVPTDEGENDPNAEHCGVYQLDAPHYEGHFHAAAKHSKDSVRVQNARDFVVEDKEVDDRRSDC